MKFRVTLKDPDGVDMSVDSEVSRFNELMSDTIASLNLDADEIDSMQEQRADVIRKYVNQWLKYGEYVTLEFDTDTGTCVVVKPS